MTNSLVEALSPTDLDKTSYKTKPHAESEPWGQQKITGADSKPWGQRKEDFTDSKSKETIISTKLAEWEPTATENGF